MGNLCLDTHINLEELTLMKLLREKIPGMTQSRLGHLVKKSQGEISLYESRQSIPSQEVLKQIAVILEYREDPENLLKSIRLSVSFADDHSSREY